MSKRITNRPILTAPERQCTCGRSYRYPWAWAIVLPERRLIDLCARCSRTLRYGNEAERQDLADRLTPAGRRAAI